MNKKLTIINIALALLAVLFGFLVYNSIRQPVVFANTKMEREIKVVQNLKDIRSTQGLFKENYNRYTANFDSLIEFIKVGELPVVNIIPDPNDTTFTKTINDTVGYIKVWTHCLEADLTSTLMTYVTSHSQNQDKNSKFKLVTSYVVV